jgi:hypothetical protein
MQRREVVVIGAGPSGSIASALLRRCGRDVLVLERQQFPRFSIGESLLAHCLDFVAEAGMMPAIEAAGFQYKNGAAFARGHQYSDFDFSDKSTPGRDSTYQVQRAAFDKVLADDAERQGVEIRYQTEIVAFDPNAGKPRVTARDASGKVSEITAEFVLDASGFGRTLPRLLGLETPSAFPVRHACFTHIADGIPAGAFDRNKIRVTIHPLHKDVWYWLIPFAGGRSSIGVVARQEFFAAYPQSPDERLRRLVGEDPGLSALLVNAIWDTPARELGGYAANVRSMHGPGFALLGNAAEFLDPVFSSGVTIAMRSASTAVAVLDLQLAGAQVHWEEEFARPLKRGVDAFRAYVTAWYDGRFQDIVFSQNQSAQVRRMVCSILAGYAWDESNPLVAEPERRLDVLAQLCAA